jgi:hypothetical protein
VRHVKTNSQSTHSHSRSNIYPVNQFDSPPQSATRSRATNDNEDYEDGKAEDQTTVEGDYASVFRARPKVKLSPVLSPRDSGHAGMMGAGLDLSESPVAIAAVAEED